MIIQLDSNFRDYVNFPFSTDFEITVNGTPPENAHSDDVRSSFLSADYIRYAFRWIGDSDIGSNPLSKVRNDSFFIEFVPVSENQFIIVPSTLEEFSIPNDYFVGLIFWNRKNGLSANVIQYSFDNFLITLDEDIFQEFICSATVKEVVNLPSNKLYSGYFVNPSIHAGNNLLLLGSTKFSSNVNSSLVIVKGLNSELYITNVTRNWTTEIVSIEGEFRNVIVKDIPSYESNDFFIVTLRPATNQLVSDTTPFENGLRFFKIIESSSHVPLNSIFEYKNSSSTVSLKVLKTDCDGKVLDVKILDPGNNLTLGVLTLTSQQVQNQTIKIDVQLLGNGINFRPNTTIQNTLNLENKLMLAVLDEKQINVLYFVIVGHIENILYLDFDKVGKNLLIDAFLPNKLLRAYFIVYYTIFPNVVIPFVASQNSICCQVRLVSLSLPNLPVCGFDARLSDFPYLLIAFSNAQGNVSDIQGQIYSNVPATNNCNFVCPISNIKNPELDFISITTKQYGIFRFKPRDSLRFQILLPNGEILRYSRSGVSFTILEKVTGIFNQRKQICVPLNVPLNKITSTSSKIIYPFVLNNNVNAVFDFQILS